MKLNEYKPTQSQRLAKARMYKWLAENPTARMEDMTIPAMQSVAKARNLSEWMAKEGFPEWWWEKSSAAIKVAAAVEIAIDRLVSILTTPPEAIGPKEAVSTKDVLSAADKLFNLADLYPKKRVEKVFMDKQIEAMDATETAEETKKLEAKLGKSEKAVDKS